MPPAAALPIVPVPIVVDDREQAAGLADVLATRWSPVYTARLDVGDVEIGPRIVVERKTVADFAASLADGRLFHQARRLAAGVEAPLLVVEGADGLPTHPRPATALRGVLAALLVGFRLSLLRTLSRDETVEFLVTIARHESRRQARTSSGTSPPRPAQRVQLDVLGAIPGIGDVRARRLLRRFGSVPAVLGAPSDARTEVEGVGPTSAAAIRAAAGAPEAPHPIGGRTRPTPPPAAAAPGAVPDPAVDPRVRAPPRDAPAPRDS